MKHVVIFYQLTKHQPTPILNRERNNNMAHTNKRDYQGDLRGKKELDHVKARKKANKRSKLQRKYRRR